MYACVHMCVLRPYMFDICDNLSTLLGERLVSARLMKGSGRHRDPL